MGLVQLSEKKNRRSQWSGGFSAQLVPILALQTVFMTGKT